MSSSSKNFQSSNKPGSEKKYQGTLVASPANAISPKSMKYILSAKQLILSGESTGHVASFLVKVVALEVVRRFSKARCPFLWNSIQALQVLGYPPFRWIQRWAPLKFVVQGIQVLTFMCKPSTERTYGYSDCSKFSSNTVGVYCGPLRLLAWEVAKILNKANVPCNLITGQEREKIDGAKHSSVTVEIADVTTEYQCAVIDEIQMVGCRTRGFSFTRALLGLCSDELHVCGDPADVPLIQRILEATGDVVTVQYYERLSPLVPLKSTLGSFSNIKAGDCMVTFSRSEIYKLKDGNALRTKFLVEMLKYKDNESKDNIPEDIQELIRRVRI